MNLDEFKGFNYEPQDTDDIIMLSDMPLSILLDSIKEQFNNPSDYALNDFVQVFETRYNLTKTEMDEDNEEEIRKLYERFIVFMRDIFKDKLNIGLPYLEDMSEDEQLQIIHYIYRFFILDIKKNFTNFTINYVNKNKAKIAEALPKKKDVTYKRLKDIIDDPNDLIIISSIPSIVPGILCDENITVDEFLELSDDDDGSLENEFVVKKYEDYNITGNFIPMYHNLLDEGSKINIECTLKNSILSKYGNEE